MSADDHDWALRLDPVDGAAFKWALNGDSGELTVWEVGGPGDGFPSHRDALAAAWGREPDGRRGDVLGTAIANEETVAIVIYGISDGNGQTKAAPAAREWAKTRFPGHRVTVNGTPG